METPSHTPGPWHIKDANPWLIYAADGYAVADVRTSHGMHPATKLDAQLIVKAVNCHDDLMEALLDLIDDKSSMPGEPRWAAYAKARAAIAKATVQPTLSKS